MTLRDICELIARAQRLTNPDGTHPTAPEIFSYSPTGELWCIFYWYEEARAFLLARGEITEDEYPSLLPDVDLT